MGATNHCNGTGGYRLPQPSASVAEAVGGLELAGPERDVGKSDRGTTWDRRGNRSWVNHTKRPFASCEQMDGALHGAWRETLGDDDCMLCGGDIALAGGLNALRLDRVATAPGKPRRCAMSRGPSGHCARCRRSSSPRPDVTNSTGSPAASRVAMAP